MQQKILVLFFIAIFLFSCSEERIIDPNSKKMYRITTVCTEAHRETLYGYEYDYNILSGKWEYFYGPHEKTICDSYRTDTVEIDN